MKYLNITKQFALLAVVGLFVTSCDKVKVPEAMGTAGQTIVQLVGGGTTAAPGILKSPIDFKPIPITVVAADLRRDIPNETALNTVMHVVVKDDTAAVRKANPAYVLLNPAWYTIGANTPKTGGNGGTYNITIPAGEFARPILITIPDATVLDPSTLYGLGFTITTVDDNGKISATNTTVVEIGAKNAYDGIYSVVSGNTTRYTAPGVPAGDALSGSLAGNYDLTLSTVGAYKVYVAGLGWSNQPANGAVGGVDPVYVTVDPATNLTTATSGANATFANWAGYTNSYDPSSRTFTFNWRWNPTSTVREYSIVIKYKGPR